MTTTADCRVFLVGLVSSGEITGPWGPTHPKYDPLYTTQSLSEPKNWKRTHKVRPEEDEYEVLVNGSYVTEPATNFAWQRRFDCVDPRRDFDGQVSYIVMERHNGSLVLGEDCGD